MKASVLNAFIDRATGDGYNAGDIYTSDDAGRMAELAAGGYLDKIEKVVRHKKPPATAEPESAATKKE